eukprot:Sdes_comp20211_c0_seq2m13558
MAAENLPFIRLGGVELPIKYLSLIILVVQNSALVMVMKYSFTSTPSEERYLASTAVIVSEIMKMVACVLITFYEKGSVQATSAFLYDEIFVKFNDTMKLSIPALLYLLQNNVLFVAVANLDAATFQVSYQLKIITTALFSVFMLGKRITAFKWLSLFVLMFGIAAVQYQPTDSNPTKKSGAVSQNVFVGLVAVFSACLSSGFAGVYFEKLLKGSSSSIWMRNIQLSIFSIICGFIGIYLFESHLILERGFFYGYHSIVWFVIANQAFGGLVVAVVVKYADNILKGFATSVSIILSSVLSIYLFSWSPSLQFVFGASLVICAVYMYSMPDTLQPLPR